MEDKSKEVTPSYTVTVYNGRFFPSRFFPLILSKWMRSFRYGNDYIKLSDPQSYYTAYNHYIRMLLLKPETRVHLAHLTDDDDVILGFCVSRFNILDYLYVQKDFRKQGIARFLLPDNIDTFTHLTRTGLKLWSVKMPKAKFNPFT